VTPPSEEDHSSSEGMKIAIISLPEITNGNSDVPAGEVSGGPVLISPQTELFLLPPDVISDLMKLTIAGSPVKKAEVSVDGQTWLPANLGEFALPAEAKSLQFRLTAEDGTQTVITREIDKSAPVIASENAPSTSGSNVLLYVLILLGLLLLAAAILTARKKRNTTSN
jgi:LPXTG-motif cell wall-anchored protein